MGCSSCFDVSSNSRDPDAWDHPHHSPFMTTTPVEQPTCHRPRPSEDPLPRQDTVKLTLSQKMIPWATLCLEERGTTTYVALHSKRVTVGRDTNASARVLAAAASLDHCTLVHSPEGVLFRDHSDVGTTVNDEFVRQGIRHVKLPLTLLIGAPPTAARITIVPAPVLVSDKYTMDTRLGEGATAVVWRGTTRDGLKHAVAVKELKCWAVRKPDMVKRFANEVHVMKRLCHANIVHIEAAFLDTAPAIVMEWVDGETLTSAVNRGIPDRQVPVIFRQLLLAVAHIHSIMIVHRDIKPANVLLDKQGVLKLADFGLAKDLGLGRCTEHAGTPLFMAPEALNPPRDGYGTPVDMWGCGQVLHFMSLIPMPDA